MLDPSIAPEKIDSHTRILPITHERIADEVIIPAIHAINPSDADIIKGLEEAFFVSNQPYQNSLRSADHALNFIVHSQGEGVWFPQHPKTTTLAEKYGVALVAYEYGVVDLGFGDLPLTPLAANSIAGHIASLFQEQDGEDFQDRLSIKTRGFLMQTAWFGELANTLSITRQGYVQNAFDFQYPAEAGLSTLIKKGITWLELGSNNDSYFKGPILDAKKEEQGIQFVASAETLRLLRGVLKANGNVSYGCPVARRSVALSKDQESALMLDGYLGDDDRWKFDRLLFGEGSNDKASRLYKLTGPTAIERTVRAWGEFTVRFADRLASEFNMPGVASLEGLDQFDLTMKPDPHLEQQAAAKTVAAQ